MTGWAKAAYEYDGSFEGFLCCVFESYLHKELPESFSSPEEPQLSLYSLRQVETQTERAQRVWRALEEKVSRGAAQTVYRGFCSCLPYRERHLYTFIRLGFERGGNVMRQLTDDRISVVVKAVRHLNGEVEKYRGFVRFSDYGGVLAGVIEPKNRVLPFLRAHFASRLPGERFVLYDKTHREMLFYEPGRWGIVPMEEFQPAAPSAAELENRRLWRRFYEKMMG